MIKTERKSYLDFYKFIGITLMVMGHVGFGQEFDKVIHFFNMPMFYIGTGFCYKSRSSTFGFIKKRAQSLLTPYIVFSSVTYLLLRDINDISLRMMFHVIWINNIDTPIASVWFLTSMFGASIIFIVIDRIENDDVKWFAYICCFLLGVYIEDLTGIILPFSMASSFVGSFFIWIGTRINKIHLLEIKFKGVRTVGVLILCILDMLLMKYNKPVNMRTGEYDNILLFLWISISSSLLLLLICKEIEAHVQSSNIYIFKILYKQLCEIGSDSICFLGLNQVAIVYSTIIVKHMNINRSYLIPIVILVISMLMMVILSKIVSKSSLRIIIGRF